MSTPTTDTDVVVIGAGPTGLTAANLLADQGISVVVIEAHPTTSDEPRAISVTDESLRVMQQIGIMDRLAPEMLMDTGARYFGRKEQLLAQVEVGAPRLGHPRKSQFDQPVMEALLLDAARRRPSIDLRFSTAVESVRECGTHVEVHSVADGERATVTARWLIACDGGRSTVRRQFDIPMEGSTQVEKWIVIDVLNTGTHERFSEFHCNGSRPVVIVPGVRGRCRFEFMLLPGEDDAAMTTPAMVNTLVRPYLHRDVAPDEVRRATVYVAHQRIATRYRQGRVLLAGDAAHMMPPFAGQGLNAGIRDAANVAWKVAAVVHGRASDALIDTYETERRAHAKQMVDLSHRIGQVVMSTRPLTTTLRDLAVVAIGVVPPAKRWITGMKFLKQPHLTSGCVAPPDGLPGPVAGLVGRSLPQPIVRVADGRLLPFDEVLGNRWCVVGFGYGDNCTVEVTPVGDDGGTEPTVYVDDVSGAFNQIPSGRYHAVIRPDRYVAAMLTATGEARALIGLDHYVPGLSDAVRKVRALAPNAR